MQSPELEANLEMLGFREREKPENLEENLSEQGREPITNSVYMRSSLGIESGPHWCHCAIPAPQSPRF